MKEELLQASPSYLRVGCLSRQPAIFILSFRGKVCSDCQVCSSSACLLCQYVLLLPYKSEVTASVVLQVTQGGIVSASFGILDGCILECSWDWWGAGIKSGERQFGSQSSLNACHKAVVLLSHRRVRWKHPDCHNSEMSGEVAGFCLRRCDTFHLLRSRPTCVDC